MSERSSETTFALHESRLEQLEARVSNIETDRELLTDLRVKLAQLKIQIGITWALLSMVIAGLISVAFAAWN